MWLVNYYGGKLPEELPLIRYSGEYEASNNSYYGSTFMYSHEDNPTEDDAIGALADCIADIASKREDYQVKRAVQLEKERIANEEKLAKEKALADARELLKHELNAFKSDLKKAQEHREVLSDVLSEIDTDVINEAIEECDRTRQEVEDACTYNMNLDDDE